MKKFLVVLFLVLVMTAPILANSPVKIGTKLIDNVAEIAVLHYVINPSTHYINKITVGLNGKEIIQQKFCCQTDKKSQKAIYVIPGLKKGDILTVKVDCNKAGTLAEKIKVK